MNNSPRRLTLVDVPVSSIAPESLNDPSVVDRPIRHGNRKPQEGPRTVRMLDGWDQRDRLTYFYVEVDAAFLTDKALMFELKKGVHNFVGAERFVSRIKTHSPEPIADVEARYFMAATKDRPLEMASKQLIPVLREAAHRLDIEEPLMGGAELTEFAELAQRAMNPQRTAFDRPDPAGGLYL